jgi:hypothetical protein
MILTQGTTGEKPGHRTAHGNSEKLREAEPGSDRFAPASHLFV